MVFEPVFRRHADRYRLTGTFNSSELCHACEEESARQLGEDPARFRMILDALVHSPQLASLDSLRPIGPAPSASTVKSFNSVPEGGNRQAAPGETASPVLRRLNASIARFAELAVRQGLEERARSLLALVSRQLDDGGRGQLPEPMASQGPDSPAPAALDGQFLDWLLDGRDLAAAAFWEVATLVRELRSRESQ